MRYQALFVYLIALLASVGCYEADRELEQLNERMIPILLRQAGCRRPIVNNDKSCTLCNSDFTCSNGGTCCPKTTTTIRRKPNGLTCRQSDSSCTKYNPNNLPQTNQNKRCICGTTKFCCTPRALTTTTTGTSIPTTNAPTTSISTTATISEITTPSTTTTPTTTPESTTTTTTATTTTATATTTTATATTTNATAG